MTFFEFGLRGKLVLWTAAVVLVFGIGLLLFLGFGAARTLKSQAEREMDRVVTKTAEELDLWIESRERDAVNLSELEVLAAACRGQKRDEAGQALVRIHKRSPFYENGFLADVRGTLFLDSIGGKFVGTDIMSLAA